MKLGYTHKFSSAHRLGNPNLDKAWNEETYGKCCNLHGHTWVLHAEIIGNVDKDSGMVVNFNVLKAIFDQLDHRYINEFVELPTAENLTVWFINQLKDLQLFSYIKIRLYESDKAYAEDEWRTS